MKPQVGQGKSAQEWPGKHGLDVAVISWIISNLGGRSFCGECSYQAHFRLPNGQWFRIGVTDDDVADKPGLWCDVVGEPNGRP
jgi:hypothetical protein